MKISTLRASLAGVIAGLILSAVTFSAQAVETFYHGTHCMTANVAQGALFSWSRSGITNNAASPLYVICPFPAIDQDVQATFATPQITVWASVFMPSTSPSGVQCAIRVLEAQDSGGTNSADHTVIVSQAFTVGSPSFAGLGDNDNAAATVASSSNLFVQGHLLCLLRRGETLRAYGVTLSD